MGAGFWAGFGEQFSDTVEENRKYIRKASDDRRTYLKTRGAAALASNKKRNKKRWRSTLVTLLCEVFLNVVYKAY